MMKKRDKRVRKKRHLWHISCFTLHGHRLSFTLGNFFVIFELSSSFLSRVRFLHVPLT